MKLFLHWLLWDLRRFRVPLLAWVALLVGSILLEVWVNFVTSGSNLIFNRPTWRYSMGVGIAVAEAFLLLVILSSDPSEGVDQHWKSRPPAGLAVAGSKVTLVLIFTLCLPLGGWWLGTATAEAIIPSSLPRTQPQLMNFTWIHVLVTTPFALAASAARDPGQVMARVVRVFTIFAAFLVIMLTPRLLLEDLSLSAVARREETMEKLLWNAFWAQSPVVWLAVALAVFLMARQRSGAPCWLMVISLMIPVLLIVGGMVVWKLSQ